MQFKIGQYIKCNCDGSGCTRGVIKKIRTDDDDKDNNGYWVKDPRSISLKMIYEYDAVLVINDYHIAYNAKNMPQLEGK